MNAELRVGVIMRTHGIRGEVKVYPTTDSPARFDKLKKVILRQENAPGLTLEVEKVSHFKDIVILKFKGIDNINEVERYKGAELYVKREDGVSLKEGEYYIADIIGMDVVTEEGEKLGVIRDVMETGANDVYVVKRENGKDLLIPAIRDCILKTDIVNNVMTVALLDGLLSL